MSKQSWVVNILDSVLARPDAVAIHKRKKKKSLMEKVKTMGAEIWGINK